jgi:cyclophilin family peptidyl-prolyl cis-trans isomerase
MRATAKAKEVSMRLKVLAAIVAGMFLAVTAPAQVAPPPNPDNILLLDLSSGGQVSILLRPDKAPNSVERIKVLARRGFYNGLIFHRVIEGFMAQGGDPKGDGTGGSDLPDLKAEFNDLPHVRGAMAMARAASEDSANSQFFLMLMPNLSLDNHYTVVGRVISGMQYVDAIEKGEPPANPTKIIKASIASGDQAASTASLAPPPQPVTPPLSAKEQAKADKEARRAMERALHDAEQAPPGQQ